ncbi:hypothetical protein ORI20_13005 [Mycobacterium sp. CVI_P3]|uniref:Uncharacterized protein n=1 Tax=Mycobacterium pinniadriaticum TaxID=2994102 RepID=A0ABT3SDJ7_9MYCO|nr:hypothetical protein [Mycobacterium pinniadriaticum]MCX2931201.1 hypothetical protein [Mycobacterium pinniadriaticum]MCX2937575.1 hypothetical protein [Mycobacterium pinniadriaticum]
MSMPPRPVMIAATGAVLFGALTVSGGVAPAAPSPAPAPGPTSASSSDDIADMVMDAIARQAPPTTTAVPAPPAG